MSHTYNYYQFLFIILHIAQKMIPLEMKTISQKLNFIALKSGDPHIFHFFHVLLFFNTKWLKSQLLSLSTSSHTDVGTVQLSPKRHSACPPKNDKIITEFLRSE